MKFIDFFSGIGGFRRGMELAGHKCVGFCEYDKFAVASYTAMHLLTDKQREYVNSISVPLKKNGERNLNNRQKEILKEEYRNGEWYANDIRKVDAESIPKADCWCFGFPCQDISIAGKQKGFKGNRSSLFFAVTRLLRAIEEESKPSYLLIENVKNLLSVNRGYDFARLLTELDEVGYDAEWDVLNSKNFGVPQNRERIFIVGHLRGRCTRKIFPIEGTSGENGISIIGHKDGYRRNMQTYDPDGITEALDTAQGGNREFHVALPCFIDINYGESKLTENARILQSRYNKGICRHRGETSGVIVPISMTRKSAKETEIANTLTAGTPDKKRGNYSPVTGVAIPVLTPDRKNKRQNGRRMKENGEPLFTLTSQDRHGVAIEIKEATKQGYAIAHEGDSINLSVPGSATRRGRVGKGVANTLDTSCNQGIIVQVSEDLSVYAIWHEKYQCYIAIRKLTPRECLRLQGWTDEYIDCATMINSDSQLYKQAGNGVTVNVIQAIAKKMQIEK